MKRWFNTLAFFAAAGAPWVNANPIEQCLNTAHEYFIAVDVQAPQRIAATFTEDGTLTLSGNKMVGRKAIADYFAQPSNGRQLQHHLTTWQIKEGTGHKATGTIYLLLTISTPGKDDQPPSVTLLSGVYTDEYSLQDGSCLIQSRSLQVNSVMPQ